MNGLNTPIMKPSRERPKNTTDRFECRTKQLPRIAITSLHLWEFSTFFLSKDFMRYGHESRLCCFVMLFFSTSSTEEEVHEQISRSHGFTGVETARFSRQYIPSYYTYLVDLVTPSVCRWLCNIRDSTAHESSSQTFIVCYSSRSLLKYLHYIAFAPTLTSTSPVFSSNEPSSESPTPTSTSVV